VAPTTVNPRFVSAGDDKRLRVWDYLMYREERSLAGHHHRVNCVDWHPTLALIASASKDNTVTSKTHVPRQA
jgi:polyadenylation factor subunit 2